MDSITAEEYAELKCCTVQYVRRLVASGKIKAEEKFGAGGKNGVSYLIPLAECEPGIIKKYNRRHKAAEPQEPGKTRLATLSVEQLTESEREEIAFWRRVLDEWEGYRQHYGGRKTDADEKFIQYLTAIYPDMQFSTRQLYRKRKAYRDGGECALVDGRGKHANHVSAIPKEVFDIFEYFYLDQSQKSVKECIRLTALQLEHDGLDGLLPLASDTAFARRIEKDIPVPVLKYFRLGQKAFRDECAPYIRRTYDDLHSNDIWVCDNHTFDVMVESKGRLKLIRVYLTGFLDVRSRKMVGWYVTHAPCSDATLYALRRGIEKYGIPKRILSDNGREFLTHDIGGRGFRKNGREGEHEAPTILDNLGIEFRTAMVRNARAKIIERAFRDIKDMFSKLNEGYTGGTISERPERLKEMAKKASNFTPYADFVEYVDVFIEGSFNYSEHRGIGMGGRTRNQVYAENLVEVRTATPEQLNLMMLRNSRVRKVTRDGVVLKIYDTEIPFCSDELLYDHIGEKVYFRYDPNDLAEVRVYDEKDRFICTAQQKTALSYFASKEDVADKMREQRRLEKAVKAYKKDKGVKAEDALALILAEAERNMAAGEHLDPKVIIPIRMPDEDAAGRAMDIAAGGDEPIDWTEALERLQKDKDR